jgi:phage/conjugal plasmid C-4 type zinc finger TraR family protein
MADPVDIANDKNDELILNTLNNRPHFDRPSAHECEDCGNKIPEQRRALGNVKLCIDCQISIENDSKHKFRKVGYL